MPWTPNAPLLPVTEINQLRRQSSRVIVFFYRYKHWSASSYMEYLIQMLTKRECMFASPRLPLTPSKIASWCILHAPMDDVSGRARSLGGDTLNDGRGWCHYSSDKRMQQRYTVLHHILFFFAILSHHSKKRGRWYKNMSEHMLMCKQLCLHWSNAESS